MALTRESAAILRDRVPASSRRDLLLSGLAMIGLGVALGILAQWLLRGGLSEGLGAMFEQNDWPGESQRTQRAEVLWWLTAGGVLSALLAVVFIAGGLSSLNRLLRSDVKAG